MITKLKIGNLTVENANGYYLRDIQTIGVGTKYSIAELLSRQGAVLGNSVYRNKSFSATVFVVGTSASDLLDKRNTLLSELKINNYSDDDKITFEFTLVNGVAISISGNVKDINVDLDNTMVSASAINFIVETEKPFFLSKIIYQQTIPITVGGGCEVPMTIPLDMSTGVSIGTSVTAGGNVFTFPTYRFVGGLTEPVLTHVESGETMSIDATIGSTAYFDVNTYDRTVVDNSGANKLDKLLGEFLVVNTGSNLFKLTTDNLGDTGYIIITYQYAYATI